MPGRSSSPTCEYVKSLGDAASSMDKMADFIKDAQRQGRNFWRLVAARFAVGAAFSVTSSVFVKGVVQGLNILDPASWNANDFSKLLLDGTLVIGMGPHTLRDPVAVRRKAPFSTRT